MNKFASVILFDVGCRKLSLSDDSFFSRSKQCLSRLILRKIFAEDSDDVGVVLFGSEVSENCMMDKDANKYSNIRELCNFGKPNFKLIDEIEKITQCKGYISDWVLAMIVALEYLRKGIQGKRYKLRQLIVFSEFPAVLDYKDALVETIANCMKDLKVKLIIIGPDMDLDDVPNNLNLVFKLFEMIDDPLSISLEELADSCKYFEKKRKTKRVFNVDLEIGSSIKIPVGWVKLTSESQRFTNWIDKELADCHSDGGNIKDGETLKPKINAIPESMDLDDDFEVSSLTSIKSKESVEDVFKIAKFGETEVTFSSADMNALKRLSGPPSFKILMFTSKRQVNPTMYVGEDIFAIMPREGSKYAQAKLYALIDAMREKNKVAISRRIVMKNGKIQLGVLIPFSDDCGKHLYFLKLPTAEWSQPFPRHRGYPKIDPELKNSFQNLINLMKLPADLLDQSVLVPNPHFQLRCHLFSQQAMNPCNDLNVLPDYINCIVNPCPEVKEDIKQTLDEIINKLPQLNTKVRKNATKARESARKEIKANNQTVRNNDKHLSSAVKAESDISIKKEENSSTEANKSVEDKDEDMACFFELINHLGENIQD